MIYVGYLHENAAGCSLNCFPLAGFADAPPGEIGPQLLVFPLRVAPQEGRGLGRRSELLSRARQRGKQIEKLIPARDEDNMHRGRGKRE